MISKANRFRGQNILNKIVKGGMKVHSKHLLLMYGDLKNEPDNIKFAVGVSKKLKLKGVKRNYVRRKLYQVIYEVMQANINIPAGKGYFVLLLAIPEGKSYQLLVLELKEMLNKIA